jgi:hypothetical protein
MRTIFDLTKFDSMNTSWGYQLQLFYVDVLHQSSFLPVPLTTTTFQHRSYQFIIAFN